MIRCFSLYVHMSRSHPQKQRVHSHKHPSHSWAPDLWAHAAWTNQVKQCGTRDTTLRCFYCGSHKHNALWPLSKHPPCPAPARLLFLSSISPIFCAAIADVFFSWLTAPSQKNISCFRSPDKIKGGAVVKPLSRLHTPVIKISSTNTESPDSEFQWYVPCINYQGLNQVTE